MTFYDYLNSIDDYIDINHGIPESFLFRNITKNAGDTVLRDWRCQ